jgi:hypothetical protein
VPASSRETAGQASGPTKQIAFSWSCSSQGVGAGFARTDAHDLLQAGDEDLAVADLAGIGGPLDRLDHALQQFGSASVIGRNAKAEGSAFIYDGTPEKLGFSLGANAASATLVITEPSGKVVKEIDLGKLKAGYNEAEWNGAGKSGQADHGLYSFSIEAKGLDGKSIASKTFVRGAVTGVSLGANPALYIDGIETSRGLVTEIY